MNIKELYRASLEVERETGIPALFSTAQAILEQGWDIDPIQGSNNIYGIKYHIKEWGYVTASTLEEHKGVKHRVVARFQKYPTLADCIRDHSSLLLRYSYKACLKKYRKNKDLKKYVECVAKDYATDSNYADKIMNIIEILKPKIKGAVIMDEFEEAKKLMERIGVFKPYGAEYWAAPPTRSEIAVLFKRFLGRLTVSVIGEGESKTYTLGGKNV